MSTMANFLIAFTVFSLIASGVVGGIFFIFSTTIMPVLANRPAADAIATMNKINEVIVRSSFIAVFLGNALVTLLLVVAGVVFLQRPGSWLMFSGAACYLIGSFVVTIAFNVPRNNALAAVSDADPSSASVWDSFLREWTWWNHVRTVACLLSALLLAVSLIYQTAANGS